MTYTDLKNLPRSITVSAENSGSHLQGIATDEKHLFCSFTTCLIKTDLQGKILGSVNGLAGHLGCIAYNASDGKVYGSLEFKGDAIGKGILKNIGYEGALKDGFYIVRFDVDKIDRPEMDAEKDGVMEAVFLNEVYNDYAADGHRYGCSGIDGITFAPAIGETGAATNVYVAYGIYGDTSRQDNDHQVLLQYDISHWDEYARPLNQADMHRCGPERPDAKYFVYTGNTTYGIQNLEYDHTTQVMLAAVYKGKKEQFPNHSLFFINCKKKPRIQILNGVNEEGAVVGLTDFSGDIGYGEICGSDFPYGSTGIISLGDGYFYMARPFKEDGIHGGVIELYRLDCEKLILQKVE